MNILWVYVLLKRIDYKDCTYESHLVIKGNENDELKKDSKLTVLKAVWHDHVFKAFYGVGIVYYFFDILYCLRTYNIFAEPCFLAGIIHHIATMHTYYYAFSITHFPWWTMAALCFHTFLITYPYWTELHVLYGFLLLAIVYGITTKPFYNTKPFRN